MQDGELSELVEEHLLKDTCRCDILRIGLDRPSNDVDRLKDVAMMRPVPLPHR